MFFNKKYLFIFFIICNIFVFASNKISEINFCKNNFIEKFQIQNLQDSKNITKNTDYYANLLKQRPYNERIYNKLIEKIVQNFTKIINDNKKLKIKKRMVYKQIIKKYQDIILFSSFFIENEKSKKNLNKFLEILNFYNKDYFLKKTKISYFVKYEIMKKTGHFIYAKDPEIFLRDYLNKTALLSKKDIPYFYWLYFKNDQTIYNIYNIEKNQQIIKKYFESKSKIFNKICYNEKKYVKEIRKSKNKRKKEKYLNIFNNYMIYVFLKENKDTDFNNIKYLTLEKNPEYQFFWYYLEYKFNKMIKNYNLASEYFLLLTKFENNASFLIEQSFELYKELITNDIIRHNYYEAWTHIKWIVDIFYKNKEKLKKKLSDKKFHKIENEIINLKENFINIAKELKNHFLKTRNINALTYINAETERIINLK